MGKPFTIVSHKLISDPSTWPLDATIKGVPELLHKGFDLTFFFNKRLQFWKKIKLC
jgi:hypothetical protein